MDDYCESLKFLFSGILIGVIVAVLGGLIVRAVWNRAINKG